MTTRKIQTYAWPDLHASCTEVRVRLTLMFPSWSPMKNRLLLSSKHMDVTLELTSSLCSLTGIPVRAFHACKRGKRTKTEGGCNHEDTAQNREQERT